MQTLFAYDQSAPLDVTEVASETRGDVSVRDIRYPSPATGDAIAAYRVVPPGSAPHPAILYVHWLEDGAPNSNRTQFVDEAVWMAQQYGVEALLVETMWAAPGWYRHGRSLDTDYDDAIRTVIELRRGLDVLLAQPNVDPARVAYVGHDFGAMYGSLLSAVEDRVQAYVFIAGASSFNRWMLFGVPPEQPGLDDYKARMEALAPARFVAQTAPAAIQFQFGSRDFYTPQDDFLAFYNAASDPKELHVYESEHAMDAPAIRADRIRFLVGQLVLESS
ncbi:MAG: hypothetical protein IT319_22410 [Anaerolineae bacterium]|nr:hypothetical protein [Anaerolineae bacterium]